MTYATAADELARSLILQHAKVPTISAKKLTRLHYETKMAAIQQQRSAQQILDNPQSYSDVFHRRGSQKITIKDLKKPQRKNFGQLASLAVKWDELATQIGKIRVAKGYLRGNPDNHRLPSLWESEMTGDEYRNLVFHGDKDKEFDSDY